MESCPNHQLVETEVHEHCTVQVLTCPKCGQVSIGWYREDQPPMIVHNPPIQPKDDKE